MFHTGENGSKKDATSNFGMTLLVFSAAVFIRMTVSLHPYSGAGKPPMYGDYEAQRHWMEITYNLPLSQWYTNSSSNDLNYWGLDYPPLTAYHSWVGGAVASRINPDWIALNSSRGYESYEHKLYMRYTVLVADVMIYFSAVYAYVKCLLKCVRTARKSDSASEMDIQQAVLNFLILLQPALVLIDYGHFQYNSLSLGLALWGVVGLMSNHSILGSIAFSLSLNYKQMELYHALPFFFFLLGKSFSPDNGRVAAGSSTDVKRNLEMKNNHKSLPQLFNIFLTVSKLGIAVLTVFAICWLPFFLYGGGISGLLHVFERLFPFNRGIYEDKVASFWCAVSLFFKVRMYFARTFLLRLCVATTMVAVLPSSLHLMRKPSPYCFLLALVSSSLSFFLFSYQVHEKSILLAALPVSLLVPHHPYLSTWFNLVATFSMYPLLVKDGLAAATWAMAGLYCVCSCVVLALASVRRPHWTVTLMFAGSLSVLLTLCTLSHIIPPPSTLPDLFPVLISCYSCGLFILSFLIFNYLQIFASSSRGEYGNLSRASCEGTNDGEMDLISGKMASTFNYSIVVTTNINLAVLKKSHTE